MSTMHRIIGQHYYQLHSLYTIQHYKKELTCHYLKQITDTIQWHYLHQNRQRSQVKLPKKELKN